MLFILNKTNSVANKFLAELRDVTSSRIACVLSATRSAWAKYWLTR
jgi:hypothetical protein